MVDQKVLKELETTVLAGLDPGTRELFDEILSKEKWWMKVFSWKWFRKRAANQLLHEAVKIFKDNNMDSKRMRGIALKSIGPLYKMADDWEPGWLYKPYL